jgi:mRNA interferase MazF
MGLKRGDLVTVALSSDYGKPRPAVVIQSDLFSAVDSCAVLPITSHLAEEPSILRIGVDPSEDNGLRKPSQIMVDKIAGVPRRKLSQPFGRLDDETMLSVNRALALFLGFA